MSTLSTTSRQELIATFTDNCWDVIVISPLFIVALCQPSSRLCLPMSISHEYGSRASSFSDTQSSAFAAPAGQFWSKND